MIETEISRQISDLNPCARDQIVATRTILNLLCYINFGKILRIFTQNCVTFTLDYIVMQIRNVNGLLQQIINVLENETKLKKRHSFF